MQCFVTGALRGDRTRGVVRRSMIVSFVSLLTLIGSAIAYSLIGLRDDLPPRRTSSPLVTWKFHWAGATRFTGQHVMQ